MNTQPFTVTSDTDLVDRVRFITGYEDDPKELPSSDMDGLIQAAKSDVYSEAETTEWYDEHHLSEVLVYTTCIKCKLHIENYSVSKWSIGNESVSTLQAVPDEEGQLMEWYSEVEDNLDDSPETDSGGTGVPELSSTFNW